MKKLLLLLFTIFCGSLIQASEIDTSFWQHRISDNLKDYPAATAEDLGDIFGNTKANIILSTSNGTIYAQTGSKNIVTQYFISPHPLTGLTKKKVNLTVKCLVCPEKKGPSKSNCKAHTSEALYFHLFNNGYTFIPVNKQYLLLSKITPLDKSIREHLKEATLTYSSGNIKKKLALRKYLNWVYQELKAFGINALEELDKIVVEKQTALYLFIASKSFKFNALRLLKKSNMVGKLNEFFKKLEDKLKKAITSKNDNDIEKQIRYIYFLGSNIGHMYYEDREMLDGFSHCLMTKSSKVFASSYAKINLKKKSLDSPIEYAVIKATYKEDCDIKDTDPNQNKKDVEIDERIAPINPHSKYNVFAAALLYKLWRVFLGQIYATEPKIELDLQEGDSNIKHISNVTETIDTSNKNTSEAYPIPTKPVTMLPHKSKASNIENSSSPHYVKYGPFYVLGTAFLTYGLWTGFHYVKSFFTTQGTP